MLSRHVVMIRHLIVFNFRVKLQNNMIHSSPSGLGIGIIHFMDIEALQASVQAHQLYDFFFALSILYVTMWLDLTI